MAGLNESRLDKVPRSIMPRHQRATSVKEFASRKHGSGNRQSQSERREKECAALRVVDVATGKNLVFLLVLLGVINIPADLIERLYREGVSPHETEAGICIKEILPSCR